jgi:hypothetical protein
MTATPADAPAAAPAAHRRTRRSWAATATWVAGGGAVIAVPLTLWLAPLDIPPTLGYLVIGVPVIAVVSFAAVDTASRRAAKHRRPARGRPEGALR